MPAPKPKFGRLHLLTVDLERTKSVSDLVYWQYQKVIVSADHAECFNTLPVPIADAESPVRCTSEDHLTGDDSGLPSVWFLHLFFVVLTVIFFLVFLCLINPFFFAA